VVPYESVDHSLVAGTEYQLPGSVTSFNDINLSNLIPQGFFKTKDDWFDVKAYKLVGGVETLQGTIRYQLLSLGHSRDYHYTDPTLPYPTIRKWRGLGAKVGDDWFIIEPDEYSINVGCKEICITDVSDGEFDGSPCVISSLKSSYNYYYGNPSTTETWADPLDRPSRGLRWNYDSCGTVTPHYALEKNNYVYFDDETSFSTSLYRFDDTSGSVSNYSVTALGSTTFHSFAPSDMSSSVTRTISSSGTISAGSGSNVFNGQADIEYLPSASSTGAGSFYLECTRAYTTESGSVDIRIYRTGGNSSAVDVTLYNDGSYQTISFASGENYKTVTINGQVHDGLRDSLDHHTDSTPPKPLDSYTLKPITIRGESWELGGESYSPSFGHTLSDPWLSKKHSVQPSRYFYYNSSVPFDRASSMFDGSVYLKVDASKNVVLGSYGVSQIRNDATCDYNDEANKTCPIHERCSYTSEHNHQAVDFEDSSTSGTLYLPTEEKHVFISGCSTYHLFRGGGMEYVEPFFVFTENLRMTDYLVQSDPVNQIPGVYLINYYIPPASTSAGPLSTTCNGTTVSYNIQNDYSNLPSGWVFFESISVVDALSCSGYTGGDEINLYYSEYTNAKPAGNSSLTDVGFERCDGWSYTNDQTYTYTTDSSSPFHEVVAKVTSDVFEFNNFQDPEDTSDTSYEFVMQYGFYAGAVFRWNGTGYDYVGQERIHSISSADPAFQIPLPLPTSFGWADDIPLWFHVGSSYYYLAPPDVSGNLEWNGPFSDPIDNTVSPPIDVLYSGRKRIRLSLAVSGVKSDWLGDTGTGIYVGDLAGLTTGSGYVTQSDTGASDIPYHGLMQWQDYVNDCGNTFESLPQGSIQMKSSDMFPFWGSWWDDNIANTFGYTRLKEQVYYGDFQSCPCLNNEWSEAYTESDKNDLFDPPASADSCGWSNCVPPLPTYEKQFAFRTGSDTRAYDPDDLPLPTSETIQITVGSTLGTTSICDCAAGTTNSGQVTQKYLDLNLIDTWDGTLTQTGTGSTNGSIRTFTTDALKGLLRRYGYYDEQGGVLENEGISLLSPDFAKFTKYTSCWSDTSHPTLVFTEADCDVQSDSPSRSWKFTSGYTLNNPTLVDYTGNIDEITLSSPQSANDHVPIGGTPTNPVYPCYKIHRWQNNQQFFVDIHPRYLELTVKAFITSWPK
jgi:hypothetical protein